MAKQALDSLSKLLSKLPIKPPWKVTGVASSVEYQPYLLPATEYRARAPASQPIRPSVPHATPERVYDIKYHVRDTKREAMLVGGTNKVRTVKSQVDVSAPLAGPPPTPGQTYRWGRRKSLLDYDNNGYT